MLPRTKTSWRDVIPLLEEMLGQGLVTDGRPYTVAIKALGDNGQTARALELLEVNVNPPATILTVDPRTPFPPFDIMNAFTIVIIRDSGGTHRQ